MKTWLRTVLAVVTVSLPLAGCAAQAAPDGTDPQAQQLAIGDALKGPAGMGKLASVDAKFSQWLVTPHGDVAGLLLDDGSVAMIPRHAAKDVNAETLKAGDAVHVEGMAREGSNVFAFASVKRGDATIVEAKRPPEGAMKAFGGKGFGKGKHGPMDPAKMEAWKAAHPEQVAKLEAWKAEHPEAAQKMEAWKAAHPEMADRPHGAMGGEKGEGFRGRKHEGRGGRDGAAHDPSSLTDQSANGTVVALLPGPHGEARGYVLSDGTVAYLKHAKHEKGEQAARVDLGVKKGDTISVSGKGGAYPLGRALVIQRVTLASGESKEI